MSTRLESPMPTKLNTQEGTGVFLKTESDAVCAVIPPSLDQLTRSAALSKLDKLRKRLGDLARDFQVVESSAKAVVSLAIEMHAQQAHKALGYDHWEDMVVGEKLQLLGLSPEESEWAMREFTIGHWSVRAAAQTLGIPKSTAWDRMKKINSSEDMKGRVPSKIRGLDGIARNRTKNPAPHDAKAPLPGQQALVLGPGNGASFDVEGFLASIGDDEEVDETADQIVMVEAISQEFRQAFDSLVAAEPNQRHASRVRKLLSHTETILDQRQKVASRWGISV